MLRHIIHVQRHYLCFGILLLAIYTSILQAKELSSDGAELYQQCSACHLSSGQGVPGLFPPLVGHLGPLASYQHGRDYLVMVLHLGLAGDISVAGAKYNGIMPAQGPTLGDAGIASVLNYVLTTFNTETLPGNWQSFTENEVIKIKSRHQTATIKHLQQLRKEAFCEKGWD